MLVEGGLAAEGRPVWGLIARPEELVGDLVVGSDDEAHVVWFLRVQGLCGLKGSFHIERMLAFGIRSGPVFATYLPSLVHI